MEYLFNKFKNQIAALPLKRLYTREDLCTADFLIEKEKDAEVYYSPHNEYINRKAAVVIAGITPGFRQMEEAFQSARTSLSKGLPDEQVLKKAKEDSRFAGPMRHHLINMLDELRLPEHLGIPSSGALFHHDSRFLHTVSLIRYPVFTKGKNYTGHQPLIGKSPMLSKWAEDTVKRDLVMPQEPLIIPLGTAAGDFLKGQCDAGILKEEQCLFGFPHPSGANGHRVKQFQEHKELLRKKIMLYF